MTCEYKSIADKRVCSDERYSVRLLEWLMNERFFGLSDSLAVGYAFSTRSVLSMSSMTEDPDYFYND